MPQRPCGYAFVELRNSPTLIPSTGYDAGTLGYVRRRQCNPLRDPRRTNQRVVMAEDKHDTSENTPDDSSEDKPLNWLGMILMLLTVLLTFGVAFPITLWITGQLQWGIYPRVMLVIPIVAIGFGFWVGVCVLCEKLGIPIQKEPATCPGCRRPLSSSRAKQCPHCGAEWT